MTMIKSFLTLLLLTFTAHAATLTLAWNASPTPSVTYNVYRSVGVANFTLVAHTSALQAVVSYDDAVLNHWFVTAVASDGVESTACNTVERQPISIKTQLTALDDTVSKLRQELAQIILLLQ